MRRRLVEHQYGSAGEQCPRDDEPPTLPTRETPALFTDEGLEPVREASDPLQDARPS